MVPGKGTASLDMRPSSAAFRRRETEVCGRAAYIVDIALKVRFLCEKLCLFHQRFMASCLNDAPLMESQGTETTSAKAAAVADQAEFDLPDRLGCRPPLRSMDDSYAYKGSA